MRNFPDSIAKRDLLHGAKKTTQAQITDLARAFEEAGWLSDAVDFWAVAKDAEALKRLKNLACSEGNSFLLFKIGRLLPDHELSTSEILECARNAEAQGKLRYAIKAYERLNDEQNAERIRSSIAQDGDIIAETEAKVFIPPAQDEIEEA